jgi:hypothetical protein
MLRPVMNLRQPLPSSAIKKPMGDLCDTNEFIQKISYFLDPRV